MGNTEETSELIRSLLASQRFGVIATQSEGQPYSNLSAIYLSKHPPLEDFLRKPSNALMRVAATG